MIKYICDCCNEEVKHLHYFEYLTHLNNKVPSYVDIDGNGISGRTDEYGLCIKCYNIIVGSVVDKFKELKK